MRLLSWLTVCIVGLGAWISVAYAAVPLVVGMDLSFPPFEQKDTKGVPSGYSVDLARAIGQKLGREVHIQNIAYDGLIPALKAHRIDMILSSMSITKSRAKIVNFSKPYGRLGLATLYRKGGIIHSCYQIDQTGVTVAVRQGTLPHIWAKRNLHRATIKPYPDSLEGLSEVIFGRADVLIYDQISLYEYHLKNPKTTIIDLTPLKNSSLDWAAAIAKDKPKLLNEVNQALDELKREGVLKEIVNRWAKKYTEGFDRLGAKFDFQ